MDASQVDSIRNILADYIDTEDPFYAHMIDALEQRENIMISDALDTAAKQARRKFSENLDKLVEQG